MKAAAAVEHAVIATLNATSAPAIKVTRLDAEPPGQQPTNMRPAAKAGGKLKSFALAHAIVGMMVNCAKKPRTKFNGATPRKSFNDRVDPIQIMVAPRAASMSGPWNHESRCGCSSPSKAAETTHTGNKLVSLSTTLLLLLLLLLLAKFEESGAL
jgi:hypothetical protein